MSEVPIISARASVMIYDDVSKKWMPSGTSPGLSKVQIYQHTANSTFRVVGRKVQDHEVVINCAIVRGLKYNQATPTFHQWRDSRQVYGLNFASREDADNFSQAMMTALETLNGIYRQPAPVAPTPQLPQHPGNVYSQPLPAMGLPLEQEDKLQKEESSNHKRQMSGGGVKEAYYEAAPNILPQAPLPSPGTTPRAPPVAPMAPPAPAAPPAPPAPPVFPSRPAGPSPPPPPSMPAEGSGGSSGPNQGSFAAALQGAKLRKTPRPEEKETVVPDRSSNPASSRPGVNAGTGAGGHINVISEMQEKLRARKAKTDTPGQAQDEVDLPTPSGASEIKRPWEKDSNTGSLTRPGHANGSESPKPQRKRNMSLSGQETFASAADAGAVVPNSELEILKQEILTEMRRELLKIKNEIIDAIQQELSHR